MTDVGLFDIGLPKKNGLQVLAELRSKRATLPVLLLTARDTVDDRIIGLDAGADSPLVKPFEFKNCLLASVPSAVAAKAKPIRYSTMGC